MSDKTDYTTLQRLSAARWANERTARVDALAEALAATRAAERALPTGALCPPGGAWSTSPPSPRRCAASCAPSSRPPTRSSPPPRTRPPPRPRGVASAGYDPDGNSPDPRADR